MDPKRMTCDEFDGKGDVKLFLTKVDLATSLKGYTEDKKAQYVASKLLPPAFDVYLKLPDKQKNDFDCIKQELIKEYGKKQLSREEALQLLGDHQQIMYRILDLVKLAYPDISEAVQRMIAKDYFVRGIHPDMQKSLLKSSTCFGGSCSELTDELQAFENGETGQEHSENTGKYCHTERYNKTDERLRTATKRCPDCSRKNSDDYARLQCGSCKHSEQPDSYKTCHPIVDKGSKRNSNSQKRLQKIRKKLQMEREIRRTSGRILVPSSLRKYVLGEVHNADHCDADETYELLKDRFYWLSMYSCTQSFVGSCPKCRANRSKRNVSHDHSLQTAIPTKAMDFITVDIAHMPEDSSGFKYFLLIGDIFSKYIQSIPLLDITAPSIVKALTASWICVHGSPRFLLSHNNLSLERELAKELCSKLNMKQMQSSDYLSHGNGFADRNKDNISEILKAVLQHRKLDEIEWRQILPELVFALNCCECPAVKRVPYITVFKRLPTLPGGAFFGVTDEIENDIDGHVIEHEFSLNDVFAHVVAHLKLDKRKIKKIYDRELRLIKYREGDKVWLHVKYPKEDDETSNNKTGCRRTGPWTIISKLRNGVDFRVRNERTKEERIVHHHRISPIKDVNPEKELSSRESTQPIPPMGTEDHFDDKLLTEFHEAIPIESRNSDSSALSDNEMVQPNLEDLEESKVTKLNLVRGCV